MTTETAERKAEKHAKKEESFNQFLERAETKLMLSLIPPSDNPDAVKVLLRSAFEAGSSHGGGEIVGDLIGAMLKGPMGNGFDKQKFAP